MAEPYSRSELDAALSAAEAEVSAFLAALPAEAFLRREGEAWSPAEHLRHLDRSVRAVTRGLEMPRWLLWLRFGPARRASRAYPRLVEDYRARLAAGGRASGAFIPAREEVPPEAADTYRSDLLERWRASNQRLRAALARWPERSLERIRMPHPLLGKLTVREMVFFTLYHAHHHLEGVRLRLDPASVYLTPD
jgi:hypothetical protein